MRPPRIGRLRRDGHLLALDLVAALLLTAVYIGFAGMTAVDAQPAYTGPVWAGWVVACAVGMPVAVRRQWPLAATATALAGATAAALLDITREPCAAVALTLYLVALVEPPRRSVPALAVALAVSGAAVLAGEAVVTPAETWSGAIGIAATVWLILGASWAAGSVVRLRRAREEADAERRAEQGRVEERLRIARELHDIVSHSLSLIAVKAGVAGHVAQARPEEARDALRVIEETSRAAMIEMRRTLGVLRTDTPGSRGAALVPVPGLDDVPLLVEKAQQAGLVVDVDMTVPDALPAGIALAVHRIVQESLTNAVKYAAPARCRVEIEADRREVRVDITDDGRGGDGSGGDRGGGGLPSGGHGLVGMRERVMMYGGTFRAGPRPGGGFAVVARLPMDSAGGTT